MKKQWTRIVIAAAVMLFAFTALAFADGGEEVVNYGALCLIPPIVTIVLAFVTKQTIISMFLGIWVGATIINGFNPIDGLIGSFKQFIIPNIADSWNAGMLVIMALIGGFMYMLSACGGAEAFGIWAKKVANSTKRRSKLSCGCGCSLNYRVGEIHPLFLSVWVFSKLSCG